MSAERITKEAKPVGHISPKRWMKYIARNPAVVKRVKHPEKYRHAQASTD